MIYITWSKSSQKMKITNSVKGTWYAPVSCVVRNELNGWRPNPEKDPLLEVTRTIPDEIPYMPRTFPIGVWKIGPIEKETDPYLRPYFISTDAWQWVDEWELKDGIYLRATGRRVKDSGYGSHFSESNTTIGCIKQHDLGCLIRLVNELIEARAQGHDSMIEVTE